MNGLEDDGKRDIDNSTTKIITLLLHKASLLVLQPFSWNLQARCCKIQRCLWCRAALRCPSGCEELLQRIKLSRNQC